MAWNKATCPTCSRRQFKIKGYQRLKLVKEHKAEKVKDKNIGKDMLCQFKEDIEMTMRNLPRKPTKEAKELAEGTLEYGRIRLRNKGFYGI